MLNDSTIVLTPDPTDLAIELALTRDETDQAHPHDHLGWLLHMLVDDIEQYHASETKGQIERASSYLHTDLDTIAELAIAHPDATLILDTLTAIDAELDGGCFISRGITDQHQTAVRRVSAWVFHG